MKLFLPIPLYNHDMQLDKQIDLFHWQQVYCLFVAGLTKQIKADLKSDPKKVMKSLFVFITDDELTLFLCF